MSDTKSGRLAWVLGPAVITLLIVLVRLWGELEGWSPEWFGTEPGGGSSAMTKENPNPAPSLFGIFWLVPLFGMYFAARLRLNGVSPPHRGRAVFFAFLGFAIFAGAAVVMMNMMGKEQEANPDKPIEWFSTVGYLIAVAGWGGVALAFVGWGALAKLELWYALLARLPIVILTVILVGMDKGTHFEKMAPFAPEVSDGIRIYYLCFAQIGFWMPFTILIGTLFGTLTALVVPAKR